VSEHELVTQLVTVQQGDELLVPDITWPDGDRHGHGVSVDADGFQQRKHIVGKAQHSRVPELFGIHGESPCRKRGCQSTPQSCTMHARMATALPSTPHNTACHIPDTPCLVLPKKRKAHNRNEIDKSHKKNTS